MSRDLDPLEPPEQEAFLAACREAVAAACPALSDGTILPPFPRLFLLARVGGAPA